MHHLRKPGEEALCLETIGNVRDWFLQARGARALINRCDVRIGLDLPQWPTDDSKLVMRGFGRVKGQIHLIRLGRVLDADGEPQGFEQLRGLALLNNPEQQAAYGRLGHHFRFKEAAAAYGKGDQATSGFLDNCVGAGILRKLPARAGYEKIHSEAAPMSAPSVTEAA